MKKFPTLAILAFLAFAPAIAPCQSLPFPGPGGAGAGAGYVAPTFVTYTFVLPSANVASITSPALTLTAGDLVYVHCRANLNATSITVTSSPSNTWNPLTVHVDSALNMAVGDSYAFGVASGSTTFTCTPNASAVQTMTVVQYHPGSVTMLDTQAGGITGIAGAWNSSSFSTSAKGLIVLCASIDSTNTWTAGPIGSSAATLRAVSGSSLAGTAFDACEDTIPTASQSSITGRITGTALQRYMGTVGAFK